MQEQAIFGSQTNLQLLVHTIPSTPPLLKLCYVFLYLIILLMKIIIFILCLFCLHQEKKGVGRIWTHCGSSFQWGSWCPWSKRRESFQMNLPFPVFSSSLSKWYSSIACILECYGSNFQVIYMFTSWFYRSGIIVFIICFFRVAVFAFFFTEP